MNVVQLQDMLRGLPDDRLKQELSQPTGTVPQYLVLSEVVRRDKIREAAASAPQTTVLQDVVGTPTAPQAMPQAPAAYANGGFISPSQAMGNAGFKGFAPSEQKQPMQFGFNQNPTQMFTPNTTPQPPAPVTNTNVNVQAPTIPLPQPQFDGGQSNGPNAPSYYEQPNGYADGGIIALGDGGSPFQITGGGSISPIDDAYVSGYGGGAGGRLGVTLPFMGGDISAGISGGISGYNLRTEEEKLRDLQAQLSGLDLSYSKDGRDYGVSYSQNPMMDGSVDRSVMFNYSQPFADGGAIKMRDGSFVDRLIGAESGFDPKARNPRSSAGGLGQFIDSTWLQFLNETQPGLVDRIGQAAALQLKEDADLSKNAVDWYKGKNTGVLTSAGFEPSEGNLYLAHFLGGKGATDVLGADPSTPAIDIVGEKVVNANPFLKGMSAADVINWSNKKIGGSPTEPSVDMASMNPADREAGILSGGVMPDPRKRGIMDLFAEEDTQKGLKELGASLFVKGQEKQSLPELEPIRRGDPSLVKGIVDKTPDQILAEYRALRQGYMANGGVVKMRDGQRPADAIREEYDALPWYQKLGVAADDVVRLMASGIYGDELSAYLQSLSGPETYEQELADEKTLTEEARIRAGSAGNVAPYVLPAKGVTGAIGYGPRILKGIASSPLLRGIATKAGILGTGAYLLSPAEDTEAPSSNAAPDDFRATPSQLFVAEREAKKAAEDKAAREAEANRPTAFNDFMTYLRERDRQVQEMYQTQADEERRREAEAGGLPFLLRQLGIGMISSGGNLQQGLRGGLEQAFKAREEQTQAARDRIRELQIKQKMAGLEGSGDIAKLMYQAELDQARAAAEREPTITNLIALRGQAVQQYNDRLDVLKDEAPEVIQADPVLKGLESQIQSYDIRLGTYTGGAKIEKVGP